MKSHEEELLKLVVGTIRDRTEHYLDVTATKDRTPAIDLIPDEQWAMLPRAQQMRALMEIYTADTIRRHGITDGLADRIRVEVKKMFTVDLPPFIKTQRKEGP